MFAFIKKKIILGLECCRKAIEVKRNIETPKYNEELKGNDPVRNDNIK